MRVGDIIEHIHDIDSTCINEGRVGIVTSIKARRAAEDRLTIRWITGYGVAETEVWAKDCHVRQEANTCPQT